MPVSDKQLRIETFNDPIYQENGMVISFGAGRPCWLIDPGLPPEGEEMLAYLADEKLSPQAILLTHAHADHMAGVNEVRAVHTEVPLYLAGEEWHMLESPMDNLSGHFGFGLTVKTDHLCDLSCGLQLELDGTTWIALDVSGHSPGGRAIYCAELGVAFVGDAVFAGSVGRTDFPHSDHERFIENLRTNIMTLPDETRLIPGHGPETTVGAERADNPFLQGL